IVHAGVMYVTTHSATLALHPLTGKQLWKQDIELPQDVFKMACCGILNRGAAIYEGKLFRVTLGGFIDGWDPATGKHLWRTYTTALSNEKGGNTWPGDTATKGGAPTWLTGAYDPELDLVYWGTGNGGPWNAEARKGDNLYICSVLAFRPKTGELVWHYQFTPNDPYDYDAT
ncbi:MAG: PQQ-dependent dehydrogenase, methanol/ethanol family, partial [Burkholderiales bacterium PBB5]